MNTIAAPAVAGVPLSDRPRVVYLSYDGMTDPLGEAQVIPYLLGLQRSSSLLFTIVSCEKPARFAAEGSRIRALLDEAGIEWRPVPYTKRPPVISTLVDLVRMWREVARVRRREVIAATHCRSYLSALLGQRALRRLGVPFVFDMRGFWADERADGGLWPKDHRVYGPIYRFFKRKEQEFLRESAAVVTLTEAAVTEMDTWPGTPHAGKTVVIPCCVDLELFDRHDSFDADAVRERLAIPSDVRVVAYLGSLGTWYLLDEMLAFFGAYRSAHPGAVMVFLTPDDPDLIRTAAAALGLPRDSLRIQFARRSELPELLSIVDHSVMFIRATYSKLGSSPTKLAELLGMSIPVVANRGVGDVDTIVNSGVGVLVEQFDALNYAEAIRQLDAMGEHPAHVRACALENFSVTEGVRRYRALYGRVLGGRVMGAPAEQAEIR